MSKEDDPPVETVLEGSSSDEMIAALYDELHRLAQRERWKAGRPDSWQTTAVMHEAYLKLHQRDNWVNREHFLASAVTTMRHILVDAARARVTAKRDGGKSKLPLEAASDIADSEQQDLNILRLNDALGDLAQIDPKLAKLVDCRFFAGLSEEEAARVMGVSDRTIRRWWIQARAWIHSELEITG